MTTMVAAVAALTVTVSSGVDWRDDWAARVADEGLSVDLMAEFHHRRHTVTPPPSGYLVVLPPGRYTVESWESLIQIYFDPADWEWARRVMGCESGGNPDAVNPASGATGLFQFLPSTWRWASEGSGWAGVSVFDPPANVATAAWLYDTLGPTQWACK